jgi:hypothetical protein
MKLTQRTTATGVTLNDTFIHVVNTGDTSQDPTGSSYKVPLSLLSPLFTGGTGVSGSGRNNYVVRWTPDGTTLGNGTIRDNGTTASIGIAPNASASLYISSNVFGILSTTNSPGYSGGDFRSIGITPTSANIAVRGQASGSDAINIGAEFKANTTVATDNIGIRVYADNATNNYALQLSDGSEVSGRFLKCMTPTGQANWSDITSADTTGASGSFTSNDGKTITVTNGLITSIV